METSPADIAVGIMMALFGALGLVLASRALDDEMYVFGLSLAGFAVAFIMGLLRVHYDRQARVAQPIGTRSDV